MNTVYNEGLTCCKGEFNYALYKIDWDNKFKQLHESVTWVENESHFVTCSASNRLRFNYVVSFTSSYLSIS